MSAENPAITTSLLFTINDDAQKRNRSLDPEWLIKNADLEGVHVLNRVLFHNEVEWRCQVYIKTKGTVEPTVAWIDISPENWEQAVQIDALLNKALNPEVSGE